MSDRLSAEERATQAAWKIENHDDVAESWDTTEEWVKICANIITQAIKDVQKADAEAEREPITDKSICKKGHPRACLVVVSAAEDIGKDVVTSHYECSACAQLEAELKPLRDALEWIVNDSAFKAPEQHNELSSRYAYRAGAALRRGKG